MKSQALQKLVKSIFYDEETKRQFMSNPDRVLSQFELTDQEKRAVMNTYAKLGLATNNSPQLEKNIGPLDFWHHAPTT